MSAFTFSLLGADYQAKLRRGEKAVDLVALNETVRNLERIILRHLLFNSKRRYFLLHPHATEVGALFSYTIMSRSRLINEIKRIPLEVLGMTGPQQLARVHDWILARSDEDMPSEFEYFRREFLPAWRGALAAEAEGNYARLERFQRFLRESQYCFLSTIEGAEQSLFATMDKDYGIEIDRGDAVEYFGSNEARNLFNEARNIIEDTASEFRRAGASEQVSLPMRQDAVAIAQVHVLNTYLRRRNVTARFVLVTRSLLLHTIMSLVPHGYSFAEVRHPLFMPDIYEFNAAALQQIGTLFQQASGILRPYLIASLGSENRVGESEVLSAVAEVFGLVVDVLADIVTVQHTLEQNPILTSKILEQAGVVNGRAGDDIPQLDATSVGAVRDQILRTFQALIDALGERNDPFSKGLRADLIKRAE